MKLSRLAVLPAFALLLGAGCGDSAFGDLLVHYQLGSGGPSETCDAFEAPVIRVTLDNSDRSPHVEEAVCSDTRQEVLIRHIPADVYTVTVEGLNEAGDPAYRGEQENVRVAADTVSESPPVAISVLPPGIRLIWTFADSMMCATHDTSEIQVVAWRNGNSREFDERFDCETGLTEFELMPGTYDLRVRAIDDSSGQYTFAWNAEDIELEPGAGIIQRVATLEDCGEEGCTAP